MSTEAQPCDCIADMNAKLGEHNGGVVATMFGSPRKVCVEVYQLKTGRGTKKPPRVVASFCPFCGVFYAQASGARE